MLQLVLLIFVLVVVVERQQLEGVVLEVEVVVLLSTSGWLVQRTRQNTQSNSEK
jgi:hypothetical protein